MTDFVASTAGTVHRANKHGLPECGTPQYKGWASVDADTEAEAVLHFNLVPCQRCINDSYDLDLRRKKRHSAAVISTLDEKTYPFEVEE